jgi:diadenosine tetraphosphate (Ap4A) HIT family hydrolase
MLGNSAPHLHAHVIPRAALDAPNQPLPWTYLDSGRQAADILAAGARRLTAVLG